MAENLRRKSCILFDWGDTLMKVFPEYSGPMHLWPRVEAVPNAKETLAALHPKRTLVVATNAQDSDETEIWAALQRVGLDESIGQVYCFCKIGQKKPAPEFFAYILNDLKVEPELAVMVGDEFSVDIMGAVQAGLRGVWFNPRELMEQNGPGYCTIHDLMDLERILEIWS